MQRLTRQFPAIVILGPRQVGKTTLAGLTFPDLPRLDCEDPLTAGLLREEARHTIAARERGGLVLDEAQAVPEVFAVLRAMIDADRRRNGRFILLGSAHPGLVRGVSETLTGRAAIVDLAPLAACEARAGDPSRDWRELWLKGGFPDALRNDHTAWWEAYLRSVLERDLPQYGLRADPVFMRRLLSMLAHAQGGIANASQLGSALGVSYQTIQRHLDVLERIFLLRRLPPYFRNVGKRIVKAPKLYLRDTGLLHHLLNIRRHEDLEAHPARGASWETFVIEDVLRREAIAHPDSGAFFWRTAAGAEADLVLERGAARTVVEVKTAYGGSGRQLRVLREAMRDIGASRAWIVDQGRGIERLDEAIARAGFTDIVEGVPE
ncbi:MAG: ATP-binding protein [Betaproteobacteria bacterium]|nr:ATP-binding protein [Betaproteobacteria bacterium]MBI2962061.1 ATP-binding protein [Betaproteobacteria bacterium]